jgi:hypothetical protein
MQWICVSVLYCESCYAVYVLYVFCHRLVDEDVFYGQRLCFMQVRVSSRHVVRYARKYVMKRQGGGKDEHCLDREGHSSWKQGELSQVSPCYVVLSSY